MRRREAARWSEEEAEAAAAAAKGSGRKRPDIFAAAGAGIRGGRGAREWRERPLPILPSGIFFLKVILIIKKMAKIVQCLKNCKNSTVFKKL
jgi:hypothetical protein